MINKELYKEGRPPHCDELVLHAPGKCDYCDGWAAKAQEDRIARGINFTGEKDPNKQPCPAEVRRGLHTIEHWGGNRPISEKDTILPFEED